MTDIGSRIAESLAERMERRQLFRRAAKMSFLTISIAAAGGGFMLLDAKRALANPCGNINNVPGNGCPNGGVYGYAPCGPSPCCSSLGNGCNCGTSGGGCLSGGKCLGAQYNIYSSHCWSCQTSSPCKTNCTCVYITTCCDCGVVSSCGTPSGRCVSWYLTEEVDC